MKKLCTLLFLSSSILLNGCFGSDDTPKPDPAMLTSEDQSYFCGMTAAGHPGPKAQIHILGQTVPIWFAATRDAVGYMKLPDENNEITAVYVTDMGKANWPSPESGPWIDIKEATLVIESKRRGGMGAPAVVPFKESSSAENFIAQYGGKIVSLDDIPIDYVLGMVEIPDNPALSTIE
ncbi:nitrous oxide reductase accessory protein NosL [Kiloniella sp. EL199]|uniref:nitrous oxide reductase accessory protein NosL n=1 Tax=Kiloniella sp. EL199 TaxID=2107581 RepID=UPI000EA1E17A|nr:nitrous oxide reductase accessory protein NosL [Kiloniella sp. EL199]